MILYKYIQANRIRDIVERQIIRFTQPAKFNDPFELQPVIEGWDSSVDPQKYFRNYWNDYVKKKLPEYSRLNLDKATNVSEGIKFGLTQDSRNNGRSKLGEAIYRAKLWGDFEKLRHEAYDEVLSQWSNFMSKAQRDMLRDYLEMMNGQYGVLSLSEVWNNVLMWAHYSDSYAGYVVGLNSDNPFFSERDYGSYKEFGKLRHISYVQRRPRFESKEMHMGDLLFKKAKCWKYEKEQRIVRSLGESIITMSGDELEYPIHLFELPNTAINEVYMGPRVSEDQQSYWRQFFSGSERYSHVKLFQVGLQRKSFGLKRKHVKT